MILPYSKCRTSLSQNSWGSLSSLYETICLLGSPAPNNWINQMRREGETVTIEGFLGRETSYCQVPISYYGGSFRAQQDYGPSLLFKLAGPEMLKKLTNVFSISGPA